MGLDPGNVNLVARILRGRYCDFSHYNKRNPFDELLFIICSTRTHEGNYREAFRRFRRAFPRNIDILSARVSALEAVLRDGGLSNKKARWIRSIATRLNEAFGHVTLSPLHEWSDERCEEFLTSLPGVGKKVARCVMMYSFRRHVFPVDEHCWRISTRLGWIRRTRKNRSGSPRDEDRLQARIPAGLRLSLHVNMISLGREYCVSQSPRCNACPIKSCCRRIGVNHARAG